MRVPPGNVEFLPDADIFASGAGTLVCPVNCRVDSSGLAVMGAGLARAFRDEFPGCDGALGRVIALGALAPGGLWPTILDRPTGMTCVAFLATKDDWRNPSRPEWVRSGLLALADWAASLRFRTRLAVPRLGCGRGGLPWSEVLPMVLDAAERCPFVPWEVYGDSLCSSALPGADAVPASRTSA